MRWQKHYLGFRCQNRRLNILWLPRAHVIHYDDMARQRRRRKDVGNVVSEDSSIRGSTDRYYCSPPMTGERSKYSDIAPNVFRNRVTHSLTHLTRP